MLKIKHIGLKERYDEDEIPHQSKTGTGPILLTCLFPYFRDWLNEHPFKNEPNARLIWNLLTGGQISADSLCTVMKQLRSRIHRLLESGSGGTRPITFQCSLDNSAFSSCSSPLTYTNLAVGQHTAQFKEAQRFLRANLRLGQKLQLLVQNLNLDS